MVKTILPLRDYQEHAIQALRERWKEEEARRLAIVLPTGGGKTVVFAHLSKLILDAAPEKRVLILVHTDELVRQAAKKVKDIAPHLIVGIVKAKENEVTADVIVASVATLRNKRRMEQVRNVEIVIVDECHHAVANTYMSILEYFGCFKVDGARAVGFTATLVRGDDKSLGLVWQDVAFERDISWMVRRGYLIPPRGIAVEVPDLDLRNVKSTRKDFRDGELGEALAESLAPEKIVEAWHEHASGRKTILFAPTVASAEVFAEVFNLAGVKAEVIHGAMKQEERDAILDRHRSGATTVVANCMILTEGYDDPEVDCIIMARPTKSRGLYVQCVGRGLRVDPARPYEDQDCLVLDVVGANAVHSLRCIVDLSDKPIDKEKAKSGRKLTELEDEFDAGEGVEGDETPGYTGVTVAKEFDPLGNASARAKVWIKTSGGTYFVPAGKDAYVFIMQWPSAGRWTVGFCSAKPNQTLPFCSKDGVPLACQHEDCKARKFVGTTVHRGIGLEEAMVWAEDLATDLGAASLNTAGKDAPWRKRPASDKMKNYARGIGISLPEGPIKAGEVSDLIGKIEGTRRIDPLVAKVGGK